MEHGIICEFEYISYLNENTSPYFLAYKFNLEEVENILNIVDSFLVVSKQVHLYFIIIKFL